MDFTEQRLGVQDADDVVWVALVERQASEWACERLINDVGRGVVDINHGDGLSVGHDRFDADVIQLQNTLQHLAFLSQFGFGAVVQVYGTAKLFFIMFDT